MRCTPSEPSPLPPLGSVAGGTRVIAAANLAVGDLVDIEAGDRVPADLQLIDAASLAIDESILTGEADAADKTTTSGTDTTATLADR